MPGNRARQRSTSAAIKVTAFCAGVATIYFARPVLIPVAIAILVAFAIDPIVHAVERLVRKRAVAVGIVLCVLGVLGVLLLAVGINQAQRLAENATSYRAAIERRVTSTRLGALVLERVLPAGRHPSSDPPTPTTTPAADVAPGRQPGTDRVDVFSALPRPADMFDLAARGVHLVAVATTTLLLAAVVLLKREDLRDRLVKIFGVDSLPLTRRTLEDASGRVSRWLLMQSVLNAVFGLCVGVILFGLGVPNAVLLGLASSLLRFVPYLGVLAATVIAFVIALATSATWSVPLLVLGAYAVVEAGTSVVFEPWLYGRGTGLSLFGLAVALAFWGWLWGVPGLLMAVPVTVCVMVLSRHFPVLEPLNVLLSDAPALDPSDRFHHRLLSQDADGAGDALAHAIDPSQSEALEPEEVWMVSILRAAAEEADERLSPTDLDAYAATASELLRRDRPDGTTPKPATGDAQIVLFPSSHPLDALGAEVLATLLTQRTPSEIQIVAPPVILSEWLAASGSAATTLIAVSVARASRRRARLLARALAARLPSSRVILARLSAKPRRIVLPKAPVTGPIRYVRTVEELVRAASVD